MRGEHRSHIVVSMTSDETERVVARAQRLVSVQAGCSDDEALMLMRETAGASEIGLDILADCVMDGSVRFDRE